MHTGAETIVDSSTPEINILPVSPSIMIFVSYACTTLKHVCPSKPRTSIFKFDAVSTSIRFVPPVIVCQYPNLDEFATESRRDIGQKAMKYGHYAVLYI